MRLKSISLSGFKSFVDPTRVVLPSNMCAVVGPNGCGKSNIIDAVRWVMGESSAKTLRGESMTDVIFNGTTQRQPVSQASIELLFDNSSGKITGEFAAYSEIAVRRLVSREGTSDYFLNGNKCRRRDITDLFLGTGLGPRSYAIIEQGVVELAPYFASRLIELVDHPIVGQVRVKGLFAAVELVRDKSRSRNVRKASLPDRCGRDAYECRSHDGRVCLP